MGGGKAMWSVSCSFSCLLPVSLVHQVGQIQLTLLGEWAEVFVMLEEVQQLRGVGHPEGESAGDGLLPLQGKYSSGVT